MIIITGALGFIASNLITALNQAGFTDLVVVDDFYKWKKEKNLQGKRILEWVHRDLFLSYFEKIAPQVDMVLHLGARTDTISEDKAVFKSLNVDFSKSVWNTCVRHGIPLVYASSAATYGDGTLGFSDSHDDIQKFQPLNAYAASKHEFDCWVLQQKKTPPHWYGLKFFNVYGPNEDHKGRMASVVFHAYHQIRNQGVLKLFKSHVPEFKDGGQCRDFIYVKDVISMIIDIADNKPASGIYNVGTGQARTFEDLGKACFSSLNIPPAIDYIDMPEDLRDKYQYFTQAEMSKWKAAGLALPATTIEDGIRDYVQHYLAGGRIH